MKAALIILGCLLFLQFAYSMPVADPSSPAAEKNTPLGIFETDMFLIFDDQYSLILNSTAQMYGNIIEKARLEENPSEELTRHLAKLTQFISDVNQIASADKNVSKMIRIAELLRDMAKITRSYEAATTAGRVPANLSLSENGFLVLKAKTFSKIYDTQRKIVDAVDAYLSSGLTPEEAKKEEKLINLYNSIKNNADSKKPLFYSYEQFYTRFD